MKIINACYPISDLINEGFIKEGEHYTFDEALEIAANAISYNDIRLAIFDDSGNAIDVFDSEQSFYCLVNKIAKY